MPRRPISGPERTLQNSQSGFLAVASMAAFDLPAATRLAGIKRVGVPHGAIADNR